MIQESFYFNTFLELGIYGMIFSSIDQPFRLLRLSSLFVYFGQKIFYSYDVIQRISSKRIFVTEILEL